MSGGVSIKKIIRDVQADFFNLYAKPGYGESNLVHFLTSEINNFSEEEQTKLKDLIAKQNTQAVALVESLKKVGAYAADLAKIDSEIKAIIGDKNISLEDAKKEEVEATAVVTEETKTEEVPVETETKTEVVESTEAKSAEAEAPTMIASSVEDVKSEMDTNNDVVAEKKLESGAEVASEPAIVAETPATEAAPAVVAETPATEAAPAVVAETPATEAAPAIVAETSATEAAPAIVAETPATEAAPAIVAETPVTETAPAIVAETPATEMAPAIATETAVTEEKPFALSPIDDGVTPVAQVAAPTVESAAVLQPSVATEAPAVSTDASAVKFTKADTNPPKAILVTTAQFGKLTGSRETQKAIMTASGIFGMAGTHVAPVANVQVDEQTLMANGLLAPTEDATKKQMEGIMEQANALYKEGKTAEAQALYSQVSTMNQTMQAANTAQAGTAKVLVNTPTPAVAA